MLLILPTAGRRGFLPITAPRCTVLPVITGNARQGQTLTATPGQWYGAPTSRAYQWNRDGSPIASADDLTYLLAGGDVGAVITVTETATNDEGSTDATSAATATVTIALPANSVAPALSGTEQVGGTLSCSTGTWSGSPSYAYRWYRGSVAIPGATSSTYLLRPVDVGAIVTCVVTATNAAGSVAATSDATDAIASVAQDWLWDDGQVYVSSSGPVYVLSEGDRRATCGGGSGHSAAIRGDSTKASGKHYIEFQVAKNAGIFQVGIVDAANTSAFAGHRIGGTGTLEGGTPSGSYAGVLTFGKVIMFACDFDAGKHWVGVDGVWTQGDPAAGTSPNWSANPSGSAWEPTFVSNDGTSQSCRIPPIMTYIPPSGFSAWS